jgi:hypothetical protein
MWGEKGGFGEIWGFYISPNVRKKEGFGRI